MEKENGNSMLEMLLFTPLALFFLVAVTDVGMSFRDRSGVIDALRSSVNAHPALIPILQTFDPDAGFDTGEQRDFLIQLAEQINDGIGRSRADHTVDTSKAPFIRVVLGRLSIDPQTGQVTQTQITQPEITLNPDNFAQCGNADLGEVISSHIGQSSSLSFAHPVANVFDANAGRYLPYSYVLAAQVCSRAIGLAGGSSEAMTGRFFDFHDEQIMPLRIQPNTLW